MEDLHLALTLSSSTSSPPPEAEAAHKKRKLLLLMEYYSADNQNFDVMLPHTTLSLLPLTPPVRTHSSSKSEEEEEEEEEEEALVGWPPVNCYWRKKKKLGLIGENHHHHRNKTLYVKVKMEGIGIARKVDLTMHRSFHSLNQTLMHMFGKRQKELSSYELAYQDNEGDWLLAQDVSWRSFIQCAQRLKLLKISAERG